jgi:hypothetical protein
MKKNLGRITRKNFLPEKMAYYEVLIQPLSLYHWLGGTGGWHGVLPLP